MCSWTRERERENMRTCASSSSSAILAYEGRGSATFPSSALTELSLAWALTHALGKEGPSGNNGTPPQTEGEEKTRSPPPPSNRRSLPPSPSPSLHILFLLSCQLPIYLSARGISCTLWTSDRSHPPPPRDYEILPPLGTAALFSLFSSLVSPTLTVPPCSSRPFPWLSFSFVCSRNMGIVLFSSNPLMSPHFPFILVLRFITVGSTICCHLRNFIF